SRAARAGLGRPPIYLTNTASKSRPPQGQPRPEDVALKLQSPHSTPPQRRHLPPNSKPAGLSAPQGRGETERHFPTQKRGQTQKKTQKSPEKGTEPRKGDRVHYL